MPTESQTHWAFNRGVVSALGAARMDLDRLRIAASTQVNWIPRILGSMMLRPGLQYIGSTRGNLPALSVPFVFSSSDVAEIELTASVMRVIVDDVVLSRPAVSAAVTNATFASDLTGWTDNDEAGGTSTWSGGQMSLVGSGANAAIRDQQVTVTEPGIEHALRIVVTRGPVLLRVGSTSGGAEYLGETSLGAGVHSLAFTPSGSFYIRLMNRRKAASLVDSVEVETAGPVEIPTPWTNLDAIRFAQSGDVVFVACDGVERRKIERRSARSWSVVYYRPEDGSFRNPNASAITLTPSAISGDITLTASKPIFKSGHVGALFRITSTGQRVAASITGEDQWSNPIRVNGVEDQRKFQVAISGTWSGTVTLQYSVGTPGSWVDAQSWTGNATPTIDDGLDNQVLYYRIGIKAGNFSSGTAEVSLTFGSGSITGVVRITAQASETSVSAQVITELGGTTGSSDWAEGRWSTYRGWPTAVALHEGRLWWFGKTLIDGSVSDAYESFDEDFEGDAGPILRSIGEGPVDRIHWAVPLTRMLIGTAANSADVAPARMESDSVLTARSSSFDEPLTPTNFNIKSASTRALFADPSGTRLMDAGYEAEVTDYRTSDLSLLCPELNAAGIVQIAIQRKPDTRVHCVRADGTVGMLVLDKIENVVCWVEVQTSGAVERVMVLPRAGEDRVYYIVRRTAGGQTVRYRERWARESECVGGTLNRQADAFGVYEGAPVTTIPGAEHLNGRQVVVWADGKDIGAFLVTGGSIPVGVEVRNAVYGLPYEGLFISTKRAFSAPSGSPMNLTKRVTGLGLVVRNTHPQGIQYGTEVNRLDDLPWDEADRDSNDEVDLNAVWVEKELDISDVNSDWGTDQRFVLKAAAPRPACVLAATVRMTTNG